MINQVYYQWQIQVLEPMVVSFITHTATDWLDGKHTVFGVVQSDKDQNIVNAIAQEDEIIRITITGNTDDLEQATQVQLDAWNKVLATIKYLYHKPA